MWYTEHAMTRYGIVLGGFAGLVVLLSNIPESGILPALGSGAITAGGWLFFGRLFALRGLGLSCGKWLRHVDLPAVL